MRVLSNDSFKESMSPPPPPQTSAAVGAVPSRKLTKLTRRRKTSRRKTRDLVLHLNSDAQIPNLNSQPCSSLVKRRTRKRVWGAACSLSAYSVHRLQADTINRHMPQNTWGKSSVQVIGHSSFFSFSTISTSCGLWLDSAMSQTPQWVRNAELLEHSTQRFTDVCAASTFFHPPGLVFSD